MPIQDAPEWRQCLELLTDPTVSEVETNGPDRFFIKKSGKRIHLDSIALPSRERYFEGIEKELVPRVQSFVEYDRKDSLFEGPLEYTLNGVFVKGRCHIVLPPVSDAPQVTIAKKSTSLVTLEAIAGKGSMAEEMLEFLKASIRARLTIVFSGGTGAGKTTMLEACSKLIPMDVRIGVAEDTPELVLMQPNASYLKSLPWRPGMDEKEVATLSFVVSQFQRMRTDMLIIGETRGKEFADFLVAANSGMEGSMTTIHANNAKRCLEKMSTFAMKGSERQPVKAINTDIMNAIDIIVQLIILPDGRHRVKEIVEVTGPVEEKESAAITVSHLYVYDEETDSFIKNAAPSDALRKTFKDRGVDISPFLSRAPKTRLPNMASAEPAAAPQNHPMSRPGLPLNNGPRGGGLPIPGQGRTL